MNSSIRNTLSGYPPLVPFDISVQRLTVLTGENGAGKSRLLRNIRDGKILYTSSDGAELNPNEIRYIETVGLSFQGDAPQERSLVNLCQDNHVSPENLPQLIKVLRDHARGPAVEGVLADEEILTLDRTLYEEIKKQLIDGPLLTQPGPLGNVVSAIEKCVRGLRAQGIEIPDEKVPVLALRSFFPKIEKGLYVSVKDPFSLQLLTLFELWRQRYADNLYDKYLYSEGLRTVLPLTEEEFVERHGQKPWKVINRILKEIGTDLQFVVDEGRLVNRDALFNNLHLADKAGHRFPAAGISTGERVIFQIAMSKYIADARNIDYIKPKLVLFDEPDAHLHPSLTNQLLSTLKQEFVEQGINIIISTHSPTTVGLADEGSVVFMRPHEKPCISSRRSATNALLSEQTKLFIDLSGARLVFVEDGSDVKRFEALYSTLDFPTAKQTLIFSSISKKTPTGTVDGGKGRVRKLLKTLGDNRNIAGLIDFDGKELPDSGTYILCKNERYGIENLLLDPRILVCFLLREDTPNFSRMFNLDIKTYGDFDSISESEMQQCMNKVQTAVLGSNFDELRLVEYEDGCQFIVCSGWMLKKCHELEKLVDEQYRLKAKCQNGDPLLRICTQIIPEHPGLLPRSFRESIEALHG